MVVDVDGGGFEWKWMRMLSSGRNPSNDLVSSRDERVAAKPRTKRLAGRV